MSAVFDGFAFVMQLACMTVLPNEIPCPVCRSMMTVSQSQFEISARCKGHCNLRVAFDNLTSNEMVLERLRESWATARDFAREFSKHGDVKTKNDKRGTDTHNDDNPRLLRRQISLL